MKPLDPPGVGVARSRTESFGVVRSRSESFGVVRSRSESTGVIRSRRSRSESESSGVVGVVRSRSHSEPFGVDRSRSRPESSGVIRSRPVGVNRSLCACDQTFPFVVFFFAKSITLRVHCLYKPLFRRPTSADSRRLRMTLSVADSG